MRGYTMGIRLTETNLDRIVRDTQMSPETVRTLAESNVNSVVAKDPSGAIYVVPSRYVIHFGVGASAQIENQWNRIVLK